MGTLPSSPHCPPSRTDPEVRDSHLRRHHDRTPGAAHLPLKASAPHLQVVPSSRGVERRDEGKPQGHGHSGCTETPSAAPPSLPAPGSSLCGPGPPPALRPSWHPPCALPTPALPRFLQQPLSSPLLFSPQTPWETPCTVSATESSALSQPDFPSGRRSCTQVAPPSQCLPFPGAVLTHASKSALLGWGCPPFSLT